MPNKLSLVIVHWNTPDLLTEQLALLNSVEAQIIVINNNPEINLSSLKSKYPQIELVQNNFNRGFAFACNQGVTLAKNDWLFFLNPDVLIEPAQLNDLLAEMLDRKLDAISCSPQNGNYQQAIPSFLSLIKEFTPLGSLIPSFLFKNKTLTGGALLIKKEIIKKLGGWDERFFLWFEDSDLSKRLLDAKYKIGFSKIPIKHLGGVSFKAWNESQKRDIFFNALEVYSLKHFSFLSRFVVKLIKQRFSSRKILPVLNERVAVTVPNLKLNLLIDFLEKNSKFINKNDELIIVSSAVSNEEFWQLKIKYPSVRLVKLKQNHGFAATVNVGFRASNTAWIATINDDVILKENVFDTCLKELPNNTGAVNPLIKSKDGQLESAGIKVLKKGKALSIKEIPQQDLIQTDACNAACVVYKNQALNKVGLFDEKFGSYLEDIDLSLRLNRAGWLNIVCNKSDVVHLKHQTSKYMNWKKRYLDFKNWCLVINKNWSLKDKIIYSPQILLERLRNFYGIFK